MQLFNYQEISSTQLQARELLKEQKTPFIVCAEVQNSGKGTKDRAWFSPLGGLYFTLALELDFNLLEHDVVSFSEQSCLLTVNVFKDFLQKYFSDSKLDNLQVKPINDLYFEDAKLAGVLLESLNKTDKSILLVGIGLNIKPINANTLDRKVIALEEILDGVSFDKEDFLQALAQELSDKLLAIKTCCESET